MAAFGVGVAGGAGGGEFGRCVQLVVASSRAWFGRRRRRWEVCVFGVRRNKVAFAVSVGWVRAVCLMVRRSQWLMSWKNIGVER